jgi:hypothetical protein
MRRITCHPSRRLPNSGIDVSAPIPPLLVGERYDLTFFASHAALSAYVEPWNLDEDYVAWDALGRQLELAVVDVSSKPSRFLKRQRSDGQQVEARLRAVPTDSTENCAMFLREWLARIGGPTMPPDATLSDLLVQALIRGDIEH